MIALAGVRAALGRVPSWLWLALAIAAAALLCGVLIDNYGDRRAKQAEIATDAKWKAASDKLVQDAHRSANKADVKAAARAQDFAAKVENEKARIDAQQAKGDSPMDALFPSAG